MHLRVLKGFCLCFFTLQLRAELLDVVLATMLLPSRFLSVSLLELLHQNKIQLFRNHHLNDLPICRYGYHATVFSFYALYSAFSAKAVMCLTFLTLTETSHKAPSSSEGNLWRTPSKTTWETLQEKVIELNTKKAY